MPSRSLLTAGLLLLLATWPLTSGSASQLPEGCAVEIVEEAARAGFALAYAPRSGDYCDGEASQKQRGILVLQSVTRGPIKFGAEPLEVQVNSKNQFMLRGWDLREHGNYRLDGALHGGRLKIDLHMTIRPLGLKADSLGLYAWRKDGPTRVYAPILAGASGETIVIFRNPGRLAFAHPASLCPVSDLNCGTTIKPSFVNRDNGSALITLVLPPVTVSGLYRLSVLATETRSDQVIGVIDLEL